MSKLLKSKLFLGVMLVAVLLVVGATTTLAYTHTVTLMQGSSGSQVASLQTALGITADGVFGPMTKAAVMAYQSSHGLSADGVVGPMTGASLSSVVNPAPGIYPAGCSSFTGYSSTTGLSCASTGTTYPAGCTSSTGFSTTTGMSCSTTTTYPAGCTATSLYSSSTGLKCDGTTTGGTTTTTGTDEGELKNFDSVSADENGFSEGEDGVELYAFEMDADGSDMTVTRVDVYMGQTTTAESNNADDYFDSATLLVDGEKVADLDVSDWDEDDWDITADTDNDEFRLRFATDFVVADGDTAKVTVEFDIINNIDTGDSDNATWEIDIATDSVRALDETGFVDEYGLSMEETVTVDEVDTSTLDVSLNNNNPEAQAVEVDATDDTNGVEVLAFDLEASDGDVLIDELVVTIDDVGTLTDVNAVVNTLHLFRDGVEIASESIPTSSGVTEDVTFDIDEDATDEGLIEDGETAEFTVEADINNLDDADFDDGDGILVSFTSVLAEDEAGDNVEADGAAAGENFSFYVDGISVSFVSSNIVKTVECEGGCATTEEEQAQATIVFDVTAFGSTIYLINGVDEDGTYTAGSGLTTTTTTDPVNATSVGTYSVTGDSETGTPTHTMILEGDTARVTLVVNITKTLDPGFASVALSGIEWNDTDDTTTPLNYTLDLGDFKTADIYLGQLD